MSGQAKAGWTLEGVYREQRPYVLRTARRLGASEAEVEDVVHDVFMVVARRLAEFRGEAQLRTWLFAVTLRVLKNRRRGQARRRRREEAYGELPRKTADSGAYRTLDETQRLYWLLERLSEGQRLVFVLSELEERAAPEIAEMLGVPVNTVYSRLRTARQLMREGARRLVRLEAEERAASPSGKGAPYE